MRVTIREEKLEDAVAVWRVNEEAFGQAQEARLVDLLRAKKVNSPLYFLYFILTSSSMMAILWIYIRRWSYAYKNSKMGE